MYICKCGRSFEKKQSYVAHCGHCKINLGRSPKDRFGESRSIKTSARLEALNKLHESNSNRLIELWKDEDYREKMRNVNHITMTSQFNDFEFVYRKYMSSYKNITESTQSFVYLIENNEAIKVGFTYNLQHRLKMLGYPKVIDIIDFSDIKSGLKFEFDFHKSHKNLMIYNEYYPKSYLRIFKSIFTTFKQFMQ